MRLIILSLLLFFIQNPFSQAQKRALDHPDFDTWNRITGQKIAPNGQWVVFHHKPGKGDQILKVVDKKGTEVASFPRGNRASISWDSRYVVFMLKPALDSVNALRRKKVEKDKLPKDTLAVYDLKKKTLLKIPRVLEYKMPEKWAGWISYKLAAALPAPKDTTAVDSSKVEKKKPKKAKKVGKKNGYHIVNLNLKTQKEDTIKYVLKYNLAEEGKHLIYSTTGIDSIYRAGVYYYSYEKKKSLALCLGKGKYYQLTLDKAGKQAAFVIDLSPKTDQIKNHQLCYWTTGDDSAKVKAENGSEFLPKGWGVSQHRRLSFSDNSKRLFFGTAVPPVVQDTNLLPEEIIKVEIWNYKNGRLHTQQNKELARDKKKSYLAVWDIASDKMKQLATEEIPSVQTANKGDADWALGVSNLPYQKYISWEGFPRRQDIYLVNVKTGEQKLVLEDLRGSASISAMGNYLYWFNVENAKWYSYSVTKKEVQCLTENIPTSMADELNDVPNYSYQYGIAGWTKDDAHVLVYDRFDIWQIDPMNPSEPINLTNGRKDKLKFRYIDLDRENPALDELMLLHVYNEKTRKEGFYNLSIGQKLKELVSDDFKFGGVIKAKNSDDIVYTKQSYKLFPNLLKTDLSFAKTTKISDANPQQKDYLWGTSELCKWTSLDGKELEGLLFKPENFDSTKKYPMMVYFYERYSERLHKHQGVVPHRSTINPTFYASRGYVIFIPDIVYRDGYPGESCYNAVIPGVTSMIEKGYIDKDKIGVQGHSWGGYQIAYLVTKTNIFKAAEAGAPVSNMTSAYGGIRWGSGLNRMFQYEHGQSRIGGTLWEYPLRYIENSPIFFVDKIQTPLLILHNDKDGHVPWYQGIELYVAMRRLGKPAWMLNYNGEPHWPTSWQNIRDLSVRMQQYFDYYLKDTDIPAWMDEGIPATEKGINDGYKLVKKQKTMKANKYNIALVKFEGTVNGKTNQTGEIKTSDFIESCIEVIEENPGIDEVNASTARPVMWLGFFDENGKQVGSLTYENDSNAGYLILPNQDIRCTLTKKQAVAIYGLVEKYAN